MSLKSCVLTLAVITAALLPAYALADQIVLKNGDRVTGAIVRKDGATLTVNSEMFGSITMAWDQVVSATTVAPLNVVTKEGKTLQGPLTSAPDGALQVSGTSVAPADIAAIRNADQQKQFERLEHPGWGALWAGAASLGWAGTSGNARTFTFTTDLNAARLTRTDRTAIHFESIDASALAGGRNADTAKAVRGGIAYEHNLHPRLFASVFNDYEYDRFQNLDLRLVLGGGLGYHAIKGAKHQLDLLGGGNYNRSRFSTPLTTNAAEAYFGDDYTWKLRSNASLIQTARVFNNLTDTGNFRLNFDTGASFKVMKWLNWNLTLSDRYLNRPAPGRKTNDILYTTGLGITFAR